MSAKTFECPNCGGAIEFRSSSTVYNTCTYCQSTVVRHDLDLELIGKVSELVDMSPFQVGTEGDFAGKHFVLLGRLKIVYDQGQWSEWYAAFDDGRVGWLAEAQGHYMMSFEEKQSHFPDRESLKPGTPVIIREARYTVDDVRLITYKYSEGELPYVFEPDFEGWSIDLKGPKGAFANYLYGMNGSELFVGRYQQFDEFNFKYLKEIHGWTRR